MPTKKKTPQKDNTAAEPSNNETTRHKPRKQYPKTKIAKLLGQKALNPSLSQSQLAAINGVSKQAVGQMFARYGINEKYLESFKEHRADILSGLQDTVLSTLSLDDIKASSVRDRAVTFGVLYDKERLERGQSTSNVATILATSVIEAGKQWAKAPQDMVVDNSTGPAHNTLDAEVVEI